VDRIVEPVDTSTGGEGDGHIGGEAKDLRRDGGPHAEGLGHLGVLPERRGAGIAWARLQHLEGAGLDPREVEAEQPTQAQQAREPGAQMSVTWHGISQTPADLVVKPFVFHNSLEIPRGYLHGVSCAVQTI
jgi:GNAT superfamily N-acetyltransferase